MSSLASLWRSSDRKIGSMIMVFTQFSAQTPSRKTSKNTGINPKKLIESDIAKSRANEPIYEDLAIQ